LCEDININDINNDKIISLNENYENSIVNKINCDKQIINNNSINNYSINNIIINNMNYFNGINNFDTFLNFYLNKAIISIFINNILIRNNYFDNIGIFNNLSINDASAFLLDKNSMFPYHVNNIDLGKGKSNSDIC